MYTPAHAWCLEHLSEYMHIPAQNTLAPVHVRLCNGAETSLIQASTLGQASSNHQVFYGFHSKSVHGAYPIENSIFAIFRASLD